MDIATVATTISIFVQCSVTDKLQLCVQVQFKYCAHCLLTDRSSTSDSCSCRPIPQVPFEHPQSR